MKFDIPEEHKNKSGVYIITSNLSAKVYIGSTSNLYRRFNGHKGEFKRRHRNPELREFAAINGTDSLIFKLVELVEKDRLIERESYHSKTIEYLFNYNSI